MVYMLTVDIRIFRPGNSEFEFALNIAHAKFDGRAKVAALTFDICCLKGSAIRRIFHARENLNLVACSARANLQFDPGERVREDRHLLALDLAPHCRRLGGTAAATANAEQSANCAKRGAFQFSAKAGAAANTAIRADSDGGC